MATALPSLTEVCPLGVLVLQPETLQFQFEHREKSNVTTVTLTNESRDAPPPPSGPPTATPASTAPEEVDMSADALPKENLAKMRLLVGEEDPDTKEPKTLILEFASGQCVDLVSGEMHGAMPTPSQREGAPVQSLRFPMAISATPAAEGEYTDATSCELFKLSEKTFMATLGRLSAFNTRLYDRIDAAYDAPWDSVAVVRSGGAAEEKASSDSDSKPITISIRDISKTRAAIMKKNTPAAVPSVVVDRTVKAASDVSAASSTAPSSAKPLSPQEYHALWKFAATPAAKRPDAQLPATSCPVAAAAMNFFAKGSMDSKKLCAALTAQFGEAATRTVRLNVMLFHRNPLLIEKELKAVSLVKAGDAKKGSLDFALQALAVSAGSLDRYRAAAGFAAAQSELMLLLSNAKNDKNKVETAIHAVFESVYVSEALRWSEFARLATVMEAVLAIPAASMEPRRRRHAQLVLCFTALKLGESSRLNEVVKETFASFQQDAEDFQKLENVCSGVAIATNSLELVEAFVRVFNKTPVFYWYGLVMGMLDKSKLPIARHLFLIGSRLSPPSMRIVQVLRRDFIGLDGPAADGTTFRALGVLDDSLVAFLGKPHWQTTLSRLQFLSDYRKTDPTKFNVDRLQDHIGLLIDFPTNVPGGCVTTLPIFVNAVCSLIMLLGEGIDKGPLTGSKRTELWVQHVLKHYELCGQILTPRQNIHSPAQQLELAGLRAKLMYAAVLTFRKEESAKMADVLPSMDSVLTPEGFLEASCEALHSRWQILREVIGNEYDAFGNLWKEVSVNPVPLSAESEQLQATISGSAAVAQPFVNLVEYDPNGQPFGYSTSFEVMMALSSMALANVVIPMHGAYIETANCLVGITPQLPTAKERLASGKITASEALGLVIEAASVVASLHSQGYAKLSLTTDSLVLPMADARYCYRATGEERSVEGLKPIRHISERHLPDPPGVQEKALQEYQVLQQQDIDRLAAIIVEVLKSSTLSAEQSKVLAGLKDCRSMFTIVRELQQLI